MILEVISLRITKGQNWKLWNWARKSKLHKLEILRIVVRRAPGNDFEVVVGRRQDMYIVTYLLRFWNSRKNL